MLGEEATVPAGRAARRAGDEELSRPALVRRAEAGDRIVAHTVPRACYFPGCGSMSGLSFSTTKTLIVVAGVFDVLAMCTTPAG